MKKLLLIISFAIAMFSGVASFAQPTSTPIADKNFQLLKQLYADALAIQERFLSLKSETTGINGDKVKLIDVEPTLLQLEDTIITLLSTIMELQEALLTLKPADLKKLKSLIDKALELQQVAQSIKKLEQQSTPALPLKTPAQKALEEKRIKDMEKETYEMRERMLNPSSPFGK